MFTEASSFLTLCKIFMLKSSEDHKVSIWLFSDQVSKYCTAGIFLSGGRYRKKKSECLTETTSTHSGSVWTVSMWRLCHRVYPEPAESNYTWCVETSSTDWLLLIHQQQKYNTTTTLRERSAEWRLRFLLFSRKIQIHIDPVQCEWLCLHALK